MALDLPLVLLFKLTLIVPSFSEVFLSIHVVLVGSPLHISHFLALLIFEGIEVVVELFSLLVGVLVLFLIRHQALSFQLLKERIRLLHLRFLVLSLLLFSFIQSI